MKHGQGKLTFKRNNGKCYYEGQWIDGEPHGYGKGKIIYPNGDFYEGEMYDGNLQGKGKKVWADGDTFDGMWKNNL